jgi:hypothetical protein
MQKNHSFRFVSKTNHRGHFQKTPFTPQKMVLGSKNPPSDPAFCPSGRIFRIPSYSFRFIFFQERLPQTSGFPDFRPTNGGTEGGSSPLLIYN